MMRRSWSGLTFIDFDSRFNSRDCVDRTRTCQAINVCAECLRCDPTTINTGDPATFDRSMSLLPAPGRGWPGRGQQRGLAPQFATQLRVAPTPRLEAPRDGVEQPGFVERPLLKGGPAEETRSQLGVPADVVP